MYSTARCSMRRRMGSSIAECVWSYWREEPAGETGPEIRLGFGERVRVERFGSNAARGVEGLLLADGVVLLRIGPDPHCAARLELDLGGELRRERVPQVAGVAGQGELGF